MNYKLAPTAAMVVLMADKKPNAAPVVRRYLEQLDLSDGQALNDFIVGVWGVVPDLVKNRKYIMSYLALEFLRDNPDGQVVALAAGVDSLSLEATSAYPLATAYDIDLENMDLKRDLLAGSGCADRIHCLSADIADVGAVRAQLAQTPWDAARPTITIVEGLSYYMDKADLWRAIGLFRSPGESARRNRLVFEYLTPYEAIVEERRGYAVTIFDRLIERFKLPGVRQYTADEVGEQARALGGAAERTIVMRDIEKLRTGSNRHFTRQNDGALEAVVASI